MGIFASIFSAGIPAPDSDYWYYPVGLDTGAGIRVTPDTALQSVAVYACVRVLSETIAQLPLNVYRRLPDGGKELADDHPL